MAETIKPRLLKGFRDFLPEDELTRRRLIGILERTFKSFGFLPIDTPILEYTEILLGKGGGETDKQIYRFLDHGQRDVSLRYDLTVPFARFMAQHRNELYMPFRRYHIAKVWRGENPQKGRFREFMQCDFDIVGSDSPSADFEILMLMYTSFKALGIEKFNIHISDRSLFNRLLLLHGIGEKSLEIMRNVDKLRKIGSENVRENLLTIAGENSVVAIMNFVSPEKSFSSSMEKIKKLLKLESGDLLRIEELWKMLEECGIEEYFVFDTSITRGLDYYTGIVFETFLENSPEIGSVCSGGRYDDLASLYSKHRMPGVGSSIGLDRLIAALKKEEIDLPEEKIPQVIVLNMDRSLLPFYHRLAMTLREAGISVEVFPEKKKLANQFSYAEKKGIPFAVICGEDEIARDVITIKNLISRENIANIPKNSAADRILELLR